MYYSLFLLKCLSVISFLSCKDKKSRRETETPGLYFGLEFQSSRLELTVTFPGTDLSGEFVFIILKALHLKNNYESSSVYIMSRIKFANKNNITSQNLIKKI